jgi:hypothetical protein
LFVGLGVLLRISYGEGELGSFKHAGVGAYENFTEATPLVIRVVTATVDPPVDPARPWDRFKSIAVTATLPDGLTTLVKRLDGDHLVYLGTGGGRFSDSFPSECQTASCTRTYVLVACWAKPDTGGAKSVFMGAEIVASPDGTTPSSVSMVPSTDPLPDGMAADLARETGCEGKQSAPSVTSGL